MRRLPAERVATDLSRDLTSVYGNLETLEQCGLVRHVHLGHGPGFYTLVGRGEHEYLVCERCGAVRVAVAGELDDVRERIRCSFGYEVRFAHFAMLGKCAELLPTSRNIAPECDLRVDRPRSTNECCVAHTRGGQRVNRRRLNAECRAIHPSSLSLSLSVSLSPARPSPVNLGC